MFGVICSCTRQPLENRSSIRFSRSPFLPFIAKRLLTSFGAQGVRPTCLSPTPTNVEAETSRLLRDGIVSPAEQRKTLPYRRERKLHSFRVRLPILATGSAQAKLCGCGRISSTSPLELFLERLKSVPSIISLPFLFLILSGFYFLNASISRLDFETYLSYHNNSPLFSTWLRPRRTTAPTLGFNQIADTLVTRNQMDLVAVIRLAQSLHQPVGLGHRSLPKMPSWHPISSVI